MFDDQKLDLCILFAFHRYATDRIAQNRTFKKHHQSKSTTNMSPLKKKRYMT